MMLVNQKMIHAVGETQSLEYVNDFWLEVLGYSRSEVIGQPFSHFMNESTQRHAKEKCSEFEKRGYCKEISYQLIHKNGDIVEVEYSATLEKTQGGGVRSIATMLVKSDREKAVEKDSGFSKSKRDIALTAAGIGIFEWDVESGVAFTDEEILQQFGFDRSDANTSMAFWRTQLGEEVISKFNGYDRRQSGVEFEFDYKTVNGGIKVFKVVAQPIFCGEVIEKITGVCMEVTTHKEAQRALLDASKLASLGQLSAGVAHEINNPLAIIKGSTQFALEKIEEDSNPTELVELLQKRLTTVDSMVDRIASIVSGLRMFASDPTTIDKEQKDVAVILEESLNFCRERYTAEGINVHVIVDSMTVNCNPIQLSQTFLSLLNNAYDAIQEVDEKWIRVWGSEKNGKIELRFVDSGNGIKAEIADRIMDPFFTTKPVNLGSGLGLSVSKGIVEEHGGNLYLDSKSENTTFVVVLPIDKQQIKAA